MANKAREERRKQALDLKRQGQTQEEIARHLGVTKGAVSQWLKRAREGGEEALTARPRPGAPSRLSPEQKARLLELLQEGPEAHGFRGEFWTAGRVAVVIRQEFGISYHETHVRRLLAKLGWTSQLPVVKAEQRDEERIRQWHEEHWPELKKKP